jgi:NAD(P)-dependent dehydrogenase (short-subunit alcohol dehydrogenase family)
MTILEADLKGRVAIVTGGSQGIGAATALALGEAGASVVLTYNQSAKAALSIVEEIEKRGSRALALPLDLPKKPSIEAMVSRTLAEFGRIDILVNNAAVGSASVAHYCDPDLQDQVMFEINTLGTLFCAQAVLPVMVKQDYGKIINISSVGGGIAVFPGFTAADEMSKCSVGFLTKQIVADHPYQPIDSFSICPGAVNTRMFRESTLDHLSAEEREAFVSQLPMGRLIEPEEIAALILFLCTPAATICRGAVIDASLGLGVRPGLISESKK